MRFNAIELNRLQVFSELLSVLIHLFPSFHAACQCCCDLFCLVSLKLLRQGLLLDPDLQCTLGCLQLCPHIQTTVLASLSAMSSHANRSALTSQLFLARLLLLLS